MKSPRKVAALAASIALVAAACSSGSSDTTQTTVADTTTTTVASTTATTVASTTTTMAATTTTRPATNTIVDVATEAGSFTTLLTALEAAGLLDTLQGEGPFTVFAPTDEAFAKIPEDTLMGLLADIPVITRILNYHVVSGEILADDLAGLDSVPTLQSSDIAITVEDGVVLLNGASSVTATDLIADNGVIHVIDTALSPPRR